jgi:ubiquinone/menaquinone biosynthesis C-methylase UbiE
MPPLFPRSRWYLPGRLYDLAFGGILHGMRRSVSEAVRSAGLFPWLDICCGTGLQFRRLESGWQIRPAFGLDRNAGLLRYAAARAAGRPFVCGDAARLPFKTGAFKAVSVSFGLHDKDPETRKAMMAEARRMLAPEGRLIAVDFEKPWNSRARIGAMLAWAIERTAGREHFENGREFLGRGGLTVFLRDNGFVEVSRRDIEMGSVGVVVSRPGS